MTILTVNLHNNNKLLFEPTNCGQRDKPRDKPLLVKKKKHNINILYVPIL